MTKRQHESSESDELLPTKCFIKDRLQNDKITFFGHAEERESIYKLMERTATMGESNIALLMGVRGSGKTSVSDQLPIDIQARLHFCLLHS